MSLSEYPRSSNSSNSSVVLVLGDETSYHEWIEVITNKIRERSSAAAAYLDTGVAPTYGRPEYETRTIVARKPASDQLVVTGELLAADAAKIGRGTFTAVDKGVAYDEEDRNFYYKVDILKAYTGSKGKSTYDWELRSIIQAENDYNTKEKPYAWTILAQNVSESIMSQVRIPPAEYETKRSELNFYWLMEKIKFIQTGEGAHSMTLEVMKLLTMRMEVGRHKEFNARFTKVITGITRRGMAADVLLPIIFNTAYHYGLKGDGNHFYTQELNKLLTLPDLPAYEKTMGHMNTLYTALRGIDEYSNNVSNGVVQANVAQTDSRQRFSRSTNGPAQSHNSGGPSNSSDVNTVYGDMCLNCAKKGHMARDCQSPPSVCNVCRKSHHSSLHVLVQAVKDRRSKQKASRKPIKRTTSQMIMKAKLKESPHQEAYTGELEDFVCSSDMEEQIADMELLDANIAHAAKTEAFEEFEDEGYDEEFGANYSTVDNDINGYTLEIVDIDSNKLLSKDEVEETWNLATAVVECYNTEVTESIGDVLAALDSACSATLIDQIHINDPMFTAIRPCYNVGVRGIDRKAKAIPARYVGKHKVVGTVFFGEFKNLISVSRLFDSKHKIDGQDDHINVRNSKGDIVLTGIRDTSNMFMINLSASASTPV